MRRLVPLCLALLPGAAQEGAPPRVAPHEPLPSREEIARLPPDGGPEFNRLIFEASPYLLQHARNPVDWYPWGEEAFARARAESKPVFLSVGYSTCHWCHVMERESFEDPEVAALLDASFVCIKVDREERPDVDALYMRVTQALNDGAGGWPMTVLLTPDRRPFFAGTYFPKRGRLGRPGLLELLPAIAELWRDEREHVVEQAGALLASLAGPGARDPGSAPELGAAVLDRALAELALSYDAAHGGFGDRPKFPIPHQILFLLQQHRRTGDPRALEMALATLRAWRAGGIFDQLGYGLHRYSTDERFGVPHFEKMLYDQALACLAYVAAWQSTGADDLRRSAEELLAYVLGVLATPEGAFRSAEDADSEGEEGSFYLWTPAEVRAVLGDEEGALFARAFDVSEEGSFDPELSGAGPRRSVLRRALPAAALARELGLGEDELAARLERSRLALLAARERRPRPACDDKVLTDWNGLAIAALARAGAAFDEPRYREAAARAADFLLAHARTADGRLLKRWRAGTAGVAGTLEDHAFLAFGLIELYEATFEVRYLERALELVDALVLHFQDRERGGFFLAADDVLDLPLRTKESEDGALPSGTSVAIHDCLRLARLTGRTDLEEVATRALAAHASEVASVPSAHAFLLLALDFALGPTFEVVVAGDPASAETRALLARLARAYLPNQVCLLRPDGDDPPIARLAPFTREQRSDDGRPRVYVCRAFACQAPTSDVEAVLRTLNQRSDERD